jgi:hypothetical protein
MNYIYFIVNDDNTYDIKITNNILNIKEEYNLCIKCKYPEIYHFFLNDIKYDTLDNNFDILDIVKFCKKDYIDLMFDNSSVIDIYVISKEPLEYYILFDNIGFYYFYKDEKETTKKISKFLANNNDRYVNIFSYKEISSYFKFFNKDIYTEYIYKQPIYTYNINFIDLSYNSYIYGKSYFNKYFNNCIMEFNIHKLNIKNIFKDDINIYNSSNNLSSFNNNIDYISSIKLITFYILTILNGNIETYKLFKQICIDTFIIKPIIYYKGKLNITLYKHIEYLLNILNIKKNTRFYAEIDYLYIDINYNLIIKSIRAILYEQDINEDIIVNNNKLLYDNNVYFYKHFINWIIYS